MTSDMILIVDTGRGSGETIARMVRAEGFYAETVRAVPEVLPYGAKGLILTGENASFEFPACVLDAAVPVLSLGMASASYLTSLGGRINYLRTVESALRVTFEPGAMIGGMAYSDRYMDKLPIIVAPEGFECIGTAETDIGTTGVAFAQKDPCRYAFLFGPESNDPDIMSVLVSFCRDVCGMDSDWTIEGFIDEAIAGIREKVGQGTAVVTISGGVDSSVCAALVHRAIGDRLRCLFVDTGLMRKGEPQYVEQQFMDALGIRLHVVDASERFMDALKGAFDNEHKRVAVKETMRAVHEEQFALMPPFDFRANGTIYDDVVKYGEPEEDPRVLMPLRRLFKNEVRRVGELLGMPSALIHQRPFPAQGLAVRCIGEATPYKLNLVREAEMILKEEIESSGQDKKIGQYFAILTDIKTRCAEPERDRAAYAVVLRAISLHGNSEYSAVRLPYDLLERVSSRISQEIKGINRVLYEISTTPPATVEWE